MTITAQEATEFCEKVNDLKARTHAAYSAASGGEPDDPEDPLLKPEDVSVCWHPVKGVWVAGNDEPWYHAQGATAREALDAALKSLEGALAHWESEASKYSHTP